ncbi:vWA domain-containing protein [Nesterenkonia alkaliphila]|uniref:vWA domain-containing protein n=1 Tax=Nesterenkonia alkaliphila TaxID=1463631 RepID=UPI001E4EC67C|nr:VWA domain-containing protein [Nesterenkonia alkaliphila]
MSGGAGGLILQASSAGRTAGGKPNKPGSNGTGFTNEQGELVDLVGETSELDPIVRARAQQIAARLSVPRPRLEATAVRGAGELGSLPYRGGSDDIDLDRTLEMLTERPVPEDEDIIVRDRTRTTRSVVLLVDVSGSMRGERVRTAAAAVGALAGELARDNLGVIAFWSDAAVLLEPGQSVRSAELLDNLLRLPAKGLTNVAFPLQLAAKQLSQVPVRDTRVILLSDCVHNAGPDPRPLAAQLPRLDVLLDSSGEKDIELGRELAAKGLGIFRTIHTYRDVAPAISAVFAAR